MKKEEQCSICGSLIVLSPDYTAFPFKEMGLVYIEHNPWLRPGIYDIQPDSSKVNYSCDRWIIIPQCWLMAFIPLMYVRIPRLGASIIRRALDETIHTGVMRLGYTKATVCQQRAKKEFVVGCIRLYRPMFPDIELTVSSIVRKLPHKFCTSTSSRSAILINGW